MTLKTYTRRSVRRGYQLRSIWRSAPDRDTLTVLWYKTRHEWLIRCDPILLLPPRKGGCELHMSSGADDDAAAIVTAFNALYDPSLPEPLWSSNPLHIRSYTNSYCEVAAASPCRAS